MLLIMWLALWAVVGFIVAIFYVIFNPDIRDGAKSHQFMFIILSGPIMWALLIVYVVRGLHAHEED